VARLLILAGADIGKKNNVRGAFAPFSRAFSRTSKNLRT
jgi:hypothetical protein